MLDHATPPSARGSNRRTFFVRVIQGVHAVMGGTLAFVLGGAVLAPSFARRRTTWLRAVDLASLKEDEPRTVTLRVARQDGATETVDRKVLFLIKSGDQVRAFDSTCTHLGCRTRYNAETRQIECPCHGGVYDLEGRVVAGPPPTPLEVVVTRVEGEHVMVEV